MKKILCGLFLSVITVSLGCEITDYPVIFDSRGPYDNNVLTGQYEQAYIIPSSTVATLWSDGSDETYTLVAQDWKGDQWLRVFNNFDPSSTLIFLDQTYCDPNRQSNCAIDTAWNPDLPSDDPFDYIYDPSCSGARSVCLLLSISSRIGECGSGILGDKQGAAFELSNLQEASFRGMSVYHLPVNNSTASFNFTDPAGLTTAAPIYGQFDLYLDQRLRTIIPVAPNARYQLRWLDNYTKAHGRVIDVGLTYGVMSADFKVKVRALDGVLDRF